MRSLQDTRTYKVKVNGEWVDAHMEQLDKDDEIQILQDGVVILESILLEQPHVKVDLRGLK